MLREREMIMRKNMIVLAKTAALLLALCVYIAGSATAQIMPGSPLGDLKMKADPSGEIHLGKFGSPYVLCFFIPGDETTATEIKALQKIISGDRILSKFKIIMATRGKDDNERELARSYVKKNGFKATLAYDPETTAARAFTSFQFPSFYIVDAKGELKTMRVPSVTKPVRRLGFEEFLKIAADGGDIPMIDLVQETSATKDQLNMIGKKAPDFTLTDLNGKSFKLSSLRGKNVIAVFWNEGCPHCRAEIPLLNDYYIKNKKKFNFEILSVSRKGDAGSVKRTTDFISDKKIAFPVLIDKEEPVSNDYKIMYIPTAFFISADGTIVELMVGTPPNFDKTLDSIFTDPSRLGEKE